MIFYIAGPMSGSPNHDNDAFQDAALSLRYAGHTVITPSNKTPLGAWDAYLRADALVLLPGWEMSRRACLEVGGTYALGIPTYPLDAAIRQP